MCVCTHTRECVHARTIGARFWSAVRIARTSNLSRKWTRKKTHRFINHSACGRGKSAISATKRVGSSLLGVRFRSLKWHIFADATNADRIVVEAVGKKKRAQENTVENCLSAIYVYEESGFSQRISIARFSLCVFVVNKKRAALLDAKTPLLVISRAHNSER